ncbi:MAG: CHAP domain-containing protein [Mycobacterium sp.]|nr:CHAP domain-containing protein [Mycobacterium sp.]
MRTKSLVACAGVALAAALVATAEMLIVAPAYADPSVNVDPAAYGDATAPAGSVAVVKTRTQRMSMSSSGLGRDGWYNAGDRVTLTCWTRGQSAQALSAAIPDTGGDNLWYRVADNHYVAGADINTGTAQPLGSACGTTDSGPAAAAAAATAVGPGRAMGAIQAANSGWPGQCTWGALQKAFENVGYYPDIHGNAKLWADSARSRGWTVVDDPQPRSIVVFPADLAGASDYGHVAWVNSVSGQWINITEMNNESHGGPGAWWTRDTQHVPGMSYILMP